MNGLDTILADIRDEAAQEADRIRTASDEKTDLILRDSAAETDGAVEKIHEDTKKKIKDMQDRNRSLADLKIRQENLAVRQELIREALQKAEEKIASLPADAYFNAVLRMAVSAADEGSGAISFGAKDLERLPAGFEADLAGALPAGKTLQLSSAPAPVDSGFVLSYDGIEENCSFHEIILSRHDELSDIVRSVLFTDAAGAAGR